MAAVTAATAALAKEVEAAFARNQELASALAQAQVRRAEAEAQAASYKSEADTLLADALAELERLRADADAAESAVNEHRQRAAQLREAARTTQMKEEAEATAREAMVREKVGSVRAELAEVQQRAAELREQSSQMSKLQSEVAALRARLGKGALPLHRDLMRATKEGAAANEAAMAEIARLREQRDNLANEVAALTAERSALQKDLAGAVEARRSAEETATALSKEALEQQAALQIAKARAARDGLFFSEESPSAASKSSAGAAVPEEADSSGAKGGEMERKEEGEREEEEERGDSSSYDGQTLFSLAAPRAAAGPGPLLGTDEFMRMMESWPAALSGGSGGEV
jgi:hypothetical protein